MRAINSRKTRSVTAFHASIRVRKRKDASTYTSVLCMLNRKHTSPSFNDHQEAGFQTLANKTCPAKALEVWSTARPAADGFRGTSWCSHHVDHLTGVNDATRIRYRRYVANDIAPSAIGRLANQK
jgi:hypothetical protein